MRNNTSATLPIKSPVASSFLCITSLAAWKSPPYPRSRLRLKYQGCLLDKYNYRPKTWAGNW